MKKQTDKVCSNSVNGGPHEEPTTGRSSGPHWIQSSPSTLVSMRLRPCHGLCFWISETWYFVTPYVSSQRFPYLHWLELISVSKKPKGKIERPLEWEKHRFDLLCCYFLASVSRYLLSACSERRGGYGGNQENLFSRCLYSARTLGNKHVTKEWNSLSHRKVLWWTGECQEESLWGCFNQWLAFWTES